MVEQISTFKIVTINKDAEVLELEDEDFGLQISIPIMGGNLASAQIVGPYEVELIYDDSTRKVVRILE